jgi:hypothetical protein
MIKNIFSTLVLLLVAVSALVAQDASTSDVPVIKSKKGEAYLPVADEWGLGISANPFLDYLGNFINGYDGFNDSPDFDFADNVANNVAIFGKMMVDENTAYRIRFNLSKGTTINKSVVLQDRINGNPDFPAFSDDWQKVNTTAIVIAPGLEKRRGSTRLQGIYGGEAIFGLRNTNVIYQYGNPMTADFVEPGSTDFTSQGFGPNLVGDPVPESTRVVENKIGANWLFGVRGFIGVEYFFAPKISLSGEFGYMLSYQIQKRGTITTETFDQGTLSVRQTITDVYDGPGSSDIGVTNFGIGLDNLNASINLLFYF